MITDNRDQTYLFVVDEMKAHYRVRDTPPTYDLEMQDDTSVDPTNHPLWADWIKVSQTSSGCVGSLIITEQDTNPNDVFCRSYGTPLQALAAAILYNTFCNAERILSNGCHRFRDCLALALNETKHPLFS